MTSKGNKHDIGNAMLKQLSGDENKPVKQISRRLSTRMSMVVETKISAHIGQKFSKSVGVVYTMNMVLGTGPLTLPYAFAQSGLLLGTAFLGLCAVLAYITATYVIETLALGNAMLFEDAREALIAEEAKLPDGEEVASCTDLRSCRSDKVFKIRERLELGVMGDKMLPGGMHELLYGLLIMHMFGTLCVYAVTVTTSIEALLPFEDIVGIPKSPIVCVFFFICVVPLCGMDMQKLKSMQSVVMCVRLLAIVCMIGGSILILKTDGVKKIPMVNYGGIPSLYANAVLAFMLHHSIPGILSPLENQDEGPGVLGRSFSIAYVIYILMAITALAAFGADVPPLYNLAFDKLPTVVNKFLQAYPLTIFSVYPIVGITLRNNLLNFCKLSPPNPYDLKPKDYLATFAVTFPPSLVAFITKDIQAIVSFFAGYFGLSLMLVAPAGLVIWARKNLHTDDDSHHDEFSLKSRWVNKPMVTFVFIAWCCAIVFNSYRLFFMPK